MTSGNSKDKPVEEAMENKLKAKKKAGGEFRVHKATVHLKHTGTELICDILGFHQHKDSNVQAVTISNPCILTQIPTETGKSAMALLPFLMSCKEQVIHIGLQDILFVADTREEIAEQHTAMFSSIIQPSKSNLIIN